MNIFLQNFCTIFDEEIKELKLKKRKYPLRKENDKIYIDCKKNSLRKSKNIYNDLKLKKENFTENKENGNGKENENENENENGKENENENGNVNGEKKFLFLCNKFFLELLGCDEIINNKEDVKKEIIAFFIDNKKNVKDSIVFLNPLKKIYAAIYLNDSEENKESSIYDKIYYLYNYCECKFRNNFTIYIETDYLMKNYKLKNIHILDFSKDLWNDFFNKEIIEEKIKSIYESKNVLCFVLAFSILLKEYKIFIKKIILKMERIYNKKNNEVILFFLGLKEKQQQQQKKKQKDREHEQEKIHIEKTNKQLKLSEKKSVVSTEKQNDCFFKKTKDIFYLLNNIDASYLQIYKLENYTRIFIYNCEKLNRQLFVSFLKQLKNFHIYFVNLNTLFGLYFSETEKNVIKVFNRCKHILQKTDKQLCLVLDGIDILAQKNKSSYREDFVTSGDNENGYSATSNNNDNNKSNRMLITTLLLCLDSIDNDTMWKGKIATEDMKEIKQKKKKEKCKSYGKQKQFYHLDIDNSDTDIDMGYIEDDNISESSQYDGVLLPYRDKKKKEEENEKKKLRKLADHLTYNKKKLKKIYEGKCKEMLKNKTSKNLSVIVLSDLDIKCFEISFIRAGRFFHHIKYS